MDKLYKKLEDRFRGTRKSVKEKLKIYLPLLNKEKKVIDIGCGRGEFLELLKENGFKDVVGVDINKMTKEEMIIKDGVEFLKNEPSNSAGAITAFHMIEHIEFDKLYELIKQAYRVLDDEGILILETPNPENIRVAGEKFFLDFTHKRVIPMDLLKFLVEEIGFEGRILRLNHNNLGNSIKDVLESVSPDYAIVAFKDKSLIDEEFFKKGVSLDLACFAFEERIKNLENRMENAEKNLSLKNLEVENEKLKTHINYLDGKLIDCKNSLEDCQIKLHNALKEKEDLLNQIANLKNETFLLNNEKNLVILEYTKKINSLNDEIDTLNSNINNLNSHLKEKQLHIQQLEEKISHLENTLINCNKEKQLLIHAFLDAKHLYEAIINSKSWKITTPIRGITNLIRRILGKKVDIMPSKVEDVLNKECLKVIDDFN